jgi:hypothetical protein
MEFMPIRTATGWQLTVPQATGDPLVLEVVKPKVTNGAVKGVLVVRCGGALVSDDVVTLTSAAKRSQLIKRLRLLGVTLSERALLALDEVCRLATAAPPPEEDGAAAPSPDDATAALPLAELLTAVVAFFEKYVVFRQPEQLVLLALWVAHTWALPAFDSTPYLYLHSAQPRSGKTRVLELLQVLVRNPWLVAVVSAAAIIRKIAGALTTMLLDEVDAIFRGSKYLSEGQELLRAALNVGYRRGQKIPRCGGKNFEELREYEVFGAKAFAGVGRLPQTTADRTIRITLARRKKNEPVARFRFRTAKAETAGLRGAFAVWAQGAIGRLREAVPDVPDGLDDRQAEIWEPLLAIADDAGGAWPAAARQAALVLSRRGGQEDGEEDASRGVELLGALRDLFRVHVASTGAGGDDLFASVGGNGTAPSVGLPTSELVLSLIDREGESWGELWGPEVERAQEHARKEGLAFKVPARVARQLAALLKPFGIHSRNIRTADGVPKGYVLGDFLDAFERYLPPLEEGPSNA